MEKLIELHRQFLEETGKSMIIYSDWELWYFYCLDTTYDHTEWAIQYLISKEYWFIKWLVENNKINIDKLKFQSDFMFPLWENFDQMGSEDIEEYSDYESLLMLLSIQEEPVSFLISLLK